LVRDIINLVLTKFTDETITTFVLLWVFVTCVLVLYWIHNRRKFHQLSHQIPASIVKNYLDSIIQNSTALKSSLFRGGGLDVGEGIPSVVPVKDLPSGQVSVAQMNQKNAEISALHARVAEKEMVIKDLEAKIAKYESGSDVSAEKDEEIQILKSELVALQAKLKAAESRPATGGGDPQLAANFAKVSKEKEELLEKLQEYEIIEEDLANLKRLQQENEQLKKSLAAYEGGGSAVAAAPVASPPPPAKAAEVEVASPPEEDFEAQMAAAIGGGAAAPAEAAPAEVAADPIAQIPAGDGEQKSAEELLSEFEKMLG